MGNEADSIDTVIIDIMSTPDAVRGKLDELREKQEEMSILYDALQRSKTIQEIFPDAFEHGQCKATWVDVGEYGKRTVNFRVTRGDGSVREMPFDDLPKQFIEDLIDENEITGRAEVDFKRNGRSNLVKVLSKIVRARKDRAYSEKRNSHSRKGR